MTDQTMPTSAELRDEMRQEIKRLRAINADMLAALDLSMRHIDRIINELRPRGHNTELVIMKEWRARLLPALAKARDQGPSGA